MTTLTRLEGWPQLLDAAIERARSQPFAYGQLDCLLFAADVIFAITGTDLASPYRDTYHDQAGAEQILLEHGGSIEQLVSSVLGDPAHASAARRGDLVVATLPTVEGGNRDCAGICVGHYFVFPTPGGLRFDRRGCIRLAWQVG